MTHTSDPHLQSSLNRIDAATRSLSRAISPEGTHELKAALKNLHTDEPALSGIVKMMGAVADYLEKKQEKSNAEALGTLDKLYRCLAAGSGQAATLQNRKKEYQKAARCFRELKNALASPPAKQDCIDALKSAVLSLEWEINPDTVNSYNQAIVSIRERFSGSKLYGSFLNILSALGKYAHQKKAGAYKDALPLIRSVSDHVEYITQTAGLPFSRKKELLDQDIRKFNLFKNRIAAAPRSKQQTRDIKIQDIEPALSRYQPKIPDQADSGGQELVELSEAQLNALEQQEASLDTKGKETPSRDKPGVDIMDDLFNPKASPVDDLLDKIHLMNVLGPDKTPGPLSHHPDDTNTQPGVKSFTPDGNTKKPLEEITKQLDRFFDLEDQADAAESTLPYTKDMDNEPEQAGIFTTLIQAFEDASINDSEEHLQQAVTELVQLNAMLHEDPDKEDLTRFLAALIQFVMSILEKKDERTGH